MKLINGFIFLFIGLIFFSIAKAQITTHDTLGANSSTVNAIDKLNDPIDNDAVRGTNFSTSPVGQGSAGNITLIAQNLIYVDNGSRLFSNTKIYLVIRRLIVREMLGEQVNVVRTRVLLSYKDVPKISTSMSHGVTIVLNCNWDVGSARRANLRRHLQSGCRVLGVGKNSSI